MSPLASPPARGFASWQRTGPYDSGVLYTSTAAAGSAGFVSPVIDVSRYAYLGGLLSGGNPGYWVTLTWYADSAATIPVGQRVFGVIGLVGQGAQIRFPNLGPFCTISGAEMSGATFGYKVVLFGTNRVHPLEFIPVQTVLIDQPGLSVPGNGSQSVYPGDYFAGPTQFYWDVTPANMVMLFQYLTFTGAWNEFARINLASAAGTQTVTMPAGAWRFQPNNNNAGAVVGNYGVIGSLTGSI